MFRLRLGSFLRSTHGRGGGIPQQNGAEEKVRPIKPPNGFLFHPKGGSQTNVVLKKARRPSKRDPTERGC